MGYNPFLPTAGARINVLCVPGGHITPDRFQTFIQILRRASVVKVHLAKSGDLERSQDGSIFFDIAANQDLSRADMFPFEPNGRCQILLGLVDGKRLSELPGDEIDGSTSIFSALASLKAQFEEMTTTAAGLVVRQLVVFHAKNALDPDHKVLQVPESDNYDVAFHAMTSLSELWTSGVTTLLRGFEDKPISMVPAGSSNSFPRMSRSPAAMQPEATPTPTSARTPSSVPTLAEPESQSDTSRGRFSIIQGMFDLQSGLWLDAMKSLSDGAAFAFENQDHLWHGKALESLLVSMLLLSWSQTSFTIPQACRSLPNRSGIFATDTSAQSGGSLKALAQLIPPLVETILELYSKVSNLDLGGSLQDLLRESRVRHVNLLVAVKGAGCVLNKYILDHLILARSQQDSTLIQSDGEFVSISRAGLSNILIETLQASQASNNLAHYTSMLVAVVSSFSTLGLGRKHAFYLKQLMQQLAPKLVEARRVGASEVGIHPAAGLPQLSNALQGVIPEMVVGTRTMLSLAASAYGIALPPVNTSRAIIPADIDDVHRKLAIWAADHSAGDVLLKIEMLRVSVGVCEALPDIPAGLHFTSNILRASKQTMTMTMRTKPLVPIISTEEQIRLLDSIKRAVSAASRLGAHGCRAEYWDDFLVRHVQIFEKDNFSKLISHEPSDLSVRASGLADTIRDPFIYNPFAKQQSATSAPVLVTGELATFAVVLQNPLEIEIEIEEICLITRGSTFQPSQHSIVLGPFSIQTFTLSGTPTTRGDLEIIGCRATIRNCYQQDFFTFVDDWKLPHAPKQKAVSRGKFRPRKLTVGDNDFLGETGIVLDPPVEASLRLRVINAQPRLIVKSSTLSQPSIMLLEGEKRMFTITVANTSTAVKADLLLVTTEDSVSTQLQDVLSKKDLSPVEIYEVQTQMTNSPAIVVKKDESTLQANILPPNQEARYVVEVSGRAGLTTAMVQADYAYLGTPSAEVKDNFYTRQIHFPLAITVNGSVEIPRCNIFPIQSDFAWHDLDYADHGQINNTGARLGNVSPPSSTQSNVHGWLKERANASDYCMLSIDLRNVWPQPLTVDIRARGLDDPETENTESWEKAYSVHEILQPGIVTRVVLLLPRLFIEDAYRPVPNLDTQKQFVLSATKMSAEAEAASRELFWYREALLKCLKGTWTEASSGRHGEIDLRKGIRLSPRMIDSLRLEHVDIDYKLTICDEKRGTPRGDQGPSLKRLGRSHFVLPNETFATLTARIHNRTQDSLQLLLRLQPSLRHQPHNIALDLSKRFAWSGVLQRALRPAIEPNGIFEAELGIIALAEGHYDINASVEEIRALRRPPAKTANGISGAGAQRRIWHARSPCLIDAVDS